MRVLAVPVQWIERACLFVALLSLIVMMCLVTADAVMRYFFTRPIQGVDGLVTEILMPLLVYPAASYVYSCGGFVRVTLFTDALSGRVRRGLFSAYDALGAALMALIAWGVGRRGLESYLANEYSVNPLGYLVAPSYFIVAIGAAALVLTMVVNILSGTTPVAGGGVD